MEELAAIVLAAGYSSRMGSFKPLLEIEGKTLLQRAVGALRDAAVDEICVVTGHNGDVVEEAVTRLEARAVANPRYHQGMYSSVQAGVAALPSGADRFFLLPVDCALVRPETIGRLARAGAALDVDVVHPARGDAIGHPPLLSAALRDEILASEPRGGLRSLLAEHAERTARVDVDDPGVTFDADTAGDLDRARALARDIRLPGEDRCLAILGERDAPVELVRHSRSVAAVAAALTVALNERGQHLCLPLVAAAALLHDVARGEPDHAEAGAALLAAMGYPRVAAIVRRHVDPDSDAVSDVDEAEVVYLADKLVLGERIVAPEERFAPRLRELSRDPVALAAARARLDVALAVRRRVEEALGHRLPMVGSEGRADAAPSSAHERRVRRLRERAAESSSRGASSRVRAASRVILHEDGEVFFGPGTEQLFALVAETGSLHQAAKSMGMSYSKAWRMAREAEDHAGMRLLSRRTGGVAGGGSALTREGRQLVDRFRALCEEADAEIDRLFDKHFADGPFAGRDDPSPEASEEPS